MTGVLGRRRIQDILLNIAGIMLPMGAGFLVVPDLIERLGAERFGILSICWMLVGYFGILDLGLGRGLTQYLAKQVGLGMQADQRAIVARRVRRWMILIGLGWMVLMLIATPLLTAANLHIAPAIKSEATLGWLILAISVPLLMWASCSVGVLEAYSRFQTVNFIRVPMGLAVFLVPWVIAHFTQHLAAVIGGLWSVRVTAALALAWRSRNYFHVKSNATETPASNDILKFGGWLTVTNIIGPMLAYFDRIAIGVVISITAVTYYTVPFDVLSRLPSIPLAMMGVFFPMLAQLHVRPENSRLHLLQTVRAAIRMLCVGWIPLMLILGLFGEQFLTQWVGVEIATVSAEVWSWIAIGVLVNGFAHVPYALLQSAGRTDITAKFHLAEFVPYFIFLWWALGIYGIKGAAIAWTARVMVDTVALFLSAWKMFPTLADLIRDTLLLLTSIVILHFWFDDFFSRSPSDTLVPEAIFLLALFLAAWISYHGRRLYVEIYESHASIR